MFVTMKGSRSIPAGRFKAECLALLDRVARTGEAVVMTKRGHPVAKVVPIRETSKPLRGSVTFRGDVVAPILDAWELEGRSFSTPTGGSGG